MKTWIQLHFGASPCIALLAGMLLYACPLAAQPSSAPLVLQGEIDARLLQQDFALFREALQKDHAGLYRYRSRAALEGVMDSCAASLDHPMTQLEFAKSVLWCISAIRDGHTGSNIARLLMSSYGEQEKLFPVMMHYSKGRAYVPCSRIPSLTAGTEILSINGIAVTSILHKLLQYLPGDGKIETKKLHTVNNGAFPFLYRWIYGNQDEFSIRYKTPRGIIGTSSIKAALVKDFECELEGGGSASRDLQLDFPGKHTALLTIKTFDDNRLAGKLDFGEFLDTAFKEIKLRKIDKLLIDLRGNAGGRDAYGVLLYAYLADRPFSYFRSIETTTETITVKDNPFLGLQLPQENHFSGKVVFLIDGLCFSTTADFCAIARSNHRGRFVGEETGGAYYGNTSGEISKIILPNTNVAVLIPTYQYTNAVAPATYPDRGVIPDYPVLPTIQDLISHKDVQLQFGLKLLAE